MVLVSSNEVLTAASGLINVGFLNNIYETVMDEFLLGVGRTVTFHLEAIKEEDVTTQSQPQAQMYNPFFGGSPVPNTTTRNKGIKVTPRDVQYTAHIKIGPVDENRKLGIGKLNSNEAMISIVAEALPHVLEALSVSVEGRRYDITETRPMGFTGRQYLMVFLEEIQEKDIENTGTSG
jgi:hypothetical protein